ncbi:hypothetical protein LXA43DRAFT_890877 [Ganoderma leucocontextum]|nr:hypothetical protein LXA43DRAFT_890877 [Ganoderma leucocontextum]
MHPSSSASLPPPPSHALASAPAPAPAPRAPRGQGGRKRAAAADDAAYHAAAGTKRGAPDRADGDRERVKRKRTDASGAAAVGSSHNAVDKEEKASLVDFTALPIDALHRYLACFDLIPDVDPSPLSAEDPGPPSSLLKQKSHLPPHGHVLRRTSTASPGPGGLSTGHRARRDPGGNRRRSSRLVEEERIPAPPPVYGDIAEVNGVLAGIAERHFREVEVREVDTLAAFMCAVKARAMFKDL